MKKFYIVLMTIVVEALLLWGVSRILGWKLIDIIFLGGILIFGIKWLFSLYIHQENNEFNAYVKGDTGQDAGGVRPFEFNMTAIDAGLLLFIAGSFLITFGTYYSYFI
ncbi:hypothetical protein [Lentibacillus amyloliquefaciens]|uniref:DUF3899 domain-containing protein n=1 Tax=Lentibacillus amyloliquefaciens TaxID=1472767 RepID=A0A0U4DSY9_9BACI|nr:hypothetical protein [Lentibacillus amyloliquefaciens]ALX48456.1 hypothetical protein AOX59_07435 [Lentibacillus amyloliquefaciens]